MAKRSTIAKDLGSRKYAQRIVKDKRKVSRKSLRDALRESVKAIKHHDYCICLACHAARF